MLYLTMLWNRYHTVDTLNPPPMRRADIKQLEKQAEALRARAEADKKRLTDMAREKDLLFKLSTQAQGSAQQQVPSTPLWTLPTQQHTCSWLHGSTANSLMLKGL